MTLPDIMGAVTLAGLAAGIGMPVAGGIIDNLKMDAAALTLAGEIHSARMTAITSGRYTGVIFETGPRSGWRLYRDGGVPGIRSAEVLSGVDRPIGPERVLSSEHPGIKIGFPVSPVPAIPPSTGILAPSSDPVAIGTTDIFSASPLGGTTGGTIYLTDGTNLRALVIYGPTGRVRLWRYSGADSTWRRPL